MTILRAKLMVYFALSFCGNVASFVVPSKPFAGVKIPPNPIALDASQSSNSLDFGSKFGNFLQKSAILPIVLASSLMFQQPTVALADGSRTIAEISGSGLVFKDTLVVESFDDPKVQGVTLYISNFQRPLAERIQKGFFEDPSSAAVGCAKTGKVKIADNIDKSKSGEEVFEESKSLFFKTLRVQRIYDQEKNTMVYVSFNTRINKGDDDNKSRFKSSLCAVNLDEGGQVVTEATSTGQP
mmetsp:Transcript_8048/g.10311  ORF Transcript_8048/g.10311 Transcript_8048/m.10311 type:complete len:240 (+) Transcript_8048:69-788(+)